ncbi:MAG: glycosyltransferase [Spirochaetaceae bacterium]|nr:glycosyltransferase [Spirochaetaceae bacterium]
MSYKVSVIVPVYNADKTLARCLSSLINQSLKELEIIAVDDGSGDDSLTILGGFAANDARVKVYGQENLGVSAARNLGISKAGGNYLAFCDSDDELVLTALELSYNEIEQTRADLLLFKHIDVLKNGIEQVVQNEALQIISAKSFSFSEHPVALIWNTVAVWGKLWRKSFITDNRLTFDTRLLNTQDALFYFTALIKYKAKVAFYNKALYYYHTDSSKGITSSFNKKKGDIFKLAYDEVAKLVKQNFSGNLERELQKELYQRKLASFLWLLSHLTATNIYLLRKNCRFFYNEGNLYLPITNKNYQKLALLCKLFKLGILFIPLFFVYKQLKNLVRN